MSFKRRVLSALGKDVLLEIGCGLELDVTARMSAEELRDALAKSKRAKLDAIVQQCCSGADAHGAFTTHLLECFGWPAGRPDGAAIPHTFAIADVGKRVEREVALWWPERRTLLEVAGHDAGPDIPPDQSPIALLLELNQLVAEYEQHGRKVSGPGLPDHLDRKDSRWFSADCIESPKAES
jgi:hypothetical protein